LSNRWIITPRPNRSPAVRLLCFPPVGGAADVFGGWSERLPSVDLGLVQLPGRISRLGEPLIRTIHDAARGVAEAVAEMPALPTVLFGHGLGAVIAFESARRLQDRTWPVLALFVSACAAPALKALEQSFATLPAEELVSRVRQRHAAVPRAVLADREMLELFVPGLRADVEMAERYQYAAGVPLACPIVACGGSADPHTSRAQLEAWRTETRGRSSVHLFEGGPLYVQQERAAVTGLIASQLTVMLGAMSRCSGTL
jgi:surfactin synthase thioesterase subunit